MPSQLLPITQVKALVGSVASVLSGVVKLFKGGGIFGAIGLLSDFSDLKEINKAALMDQLKDIDVDERKELLAHFKSKLTLEDKSLEQKIESGADCLDEVVSLGLEAWELVQKGIAVEQRVEALLKS